MEPLPSYHLDMFRQSYHMPNYGYHHQPPNPFIDFRPVETDFLNVSDGLSPGRSCRGLEVRKEKSRDAARSRRGKENYEFYELAKLLPLPAAITSQLDKASIIRLCISYLKLRDFSRKGHPHWIHDDDKLDKEDSLLGINKLISSVTYDSHQGSHILHSLDGFAFILSVDGRFLYISETVSIYLGLSQLLVRSGYKVEVIGCCVFDYIHRQDHQELSQQLSLPLPHYGASGGTSPRSGSDEASPRPPSPIHDKVGAMNPDPEKGPLRSFCIRMKSTLTKRGLHTKSTGFKVIQMITHLRHERAITHPRKHNASLIGLVGLAIALPPPTITEWRLEHDMFVMRLTHQLKILFCEEKICQLMDLCAEDIITTNLYDHCHPADLHKLSTSHSALLSKGQVLTDYYRLMNKHGGYVWLQTCATSLINKNSEDVSTVAVNYVLSGVEYSGCVMSLEQMAEQSVNSHHSTSSSQTPKQHDCSSAESNNRRSPWQQTNDSDTSSSIRSSMNKLKDDNLSKNTRRKTEKPQKRKREELKPKDSKTKEDFLPTATVSVSPNQNRLMDSIQLDASVSLPTDLSLKSSGRMTERLHRTSPGSSSDKSDLSLSQESISTQINDEEKRQSLNDSSVSTCLSKSLADFDYEKQNEKDFDSQYVSHWSDYNGIENSSLPASYFLRSLYTNRETVIRSNVNGNNNLFYQNYPNSILSPPQTYGKNPASYHMTYEKNSHQLAYGKNPISNSLAYEKGEISPALTYGKSLTSPLLTYGKNTISQSQLAPTIKPYSLPNHSTIASPDFYAITPPLSASPHDKSMSSHDMLDQSLLSKQAWCSLNVPAAFSMHYNSSSPMDDVQSPIVPFCTNIPAIKRTASVFPPHNLWYHHSQ